jgi:hypothetical protein
MGGGKRRRELNKLKKDWYVLNRKHQAQQAQWQASSSSRVADDHELYHKHSCFSRTTSGRMATETEFFHAAEGTAHTSHAPSLVSETPMEQSDFEFSSFTPDGEFADPEYESHLAEFTLGPRKRVRPIGVSYFILHNCFL